MTIRVQSQDVQTQTTLKEPTRLKVKVQTIVALKVQTQRIATYQRKGQMRKTNIGQRMKPITPSTPTITVRPLVTMATGKIPSYHTEGTWGPLKVWVTMATGKIPSNHTEGTGDQLKVWVTMGTGKLPSNHTEGTWGPLKVSVTMGIGKLPSNHTEGILGPLKGWRTRERNCGSHCGIINSNLSA